MLLMSINYYSYSLQWLSLKRQKFIISVVTNIDTANATIEDEIGTQLVVVSGATVKETLENIIASIK